MLFTCHSDVNGFAQLVNTTDLFNDEPFTPSHSISHSLCISSTYTYPPTSHHSALHPFGIRSERGHRCISDLTTTASLFDILTETLAALTNRTRKHFMRYSRASVYLFVHVSEIPVVFVRVFVVDLRHRYYLLVRVFHRHAQQRRRIVSHYAIHLVIESRILRTRVHVVIFTIVDNTALLLGTGRINFSFEL